MESFRPVSTKDGSDQAAAKKVDGWQAENKEEKNPTLSPQLLISLTSHLHSHLGTPAATNGAGGRSAAATDKHPAVSAAA
jgi:hypothetical protein